MQETRLRLHFVTNSGLLVASLLLTVAAGDEVTLRVLAGAAVAKAALVLEDWEGMSLGTGNARPAFWILIG